MEYYESDFVNQSLTPYEPMTVSQPQIPARKDKPSALLIQSIISIVLCLTILSLRFISPASLETVKGWLVTEEIGDVEQAMETMVEDIFHGESFSDAVVVFCQDVIDAQDPH